MEIKGNLVDVSKGEIYPALVKFDDKILSVEKIEGEFDTYILPGLVDSHIHIESSMLTPSRFAEAVLPHGTTAVVTDPHEIANVLGIDGINFMRNDAGQSPLKVFFTAPSCVPATDFETSGANLNSDAIKELLENDDIVALGEMMNFPGVIFNVPEVMKKIQYAHNSKKPVDGHCPGLTGDDLKKYTGAGITTDHECTSLEEAEEKAALGMKIQIREGSSAKNMETLYKLAKKNDNCFLVSDDIHADDLLSGHMNKKLKKIVSLGIDPLTAVKMATVNPVNHYGLKCGLVQPGDPADIAVVNNLTDFNVIETYVDGRLAAKDSKSLFKPGPVKPENIFDLKEKFPEDFKISSGIKTGSAEVRVIKVIENQIVTKGTTAFLKVTDGEVLPDRENDILKIAVVERYGLNNISAGFIKGFRLTRGAIASSVAHDSHNIVVVGTNDADMAKAVGTMKEMKGGVVVTADNKVVEKLPLPIAGLMSEKSADSLAEDLSKINDAAKSIGCCLHSPLMTLSFMALPVIPELKITDKGLFDVTTFAFTNIIKEEEEN